MQKAKAEAIYDILVEECDAREDTRGHFVYCQTLEDVREWRFQGCLGFGGKFRRQGDRLYVDYYPEDSTPECDMMVKAANARLKDL